MAKIYNTIFEKIILPFGDLMTGQHLLDRLFFLREAQYWDKEKLYFWKEKALKETIEIAYNEVTFYRDLMDKAKVKPRDINNPSDLSKIPIVTKDMIRKYYPEGLKRKTKHKIYEKMTSGSTGKNFAVLSDKETDGFIRASFMLSLEWAGWKIGERHFQTGMTLKRGFLKKMKDIFFRCHYGSAFDLRDSILDKYLEVIRKKKIKHIWGYPGGIYYLAKRAKELGWNIPMKSIVTWGDTLEIKSRRLIEEVFKKKVNDTYGCGEGVQIAAQCGYNDNYHIHSLDVIVEVVDDEGNPLPPGKPGNIILTRLYPGPMPLIRYRVGDRGTLGDELCNCGRSFEILKAVLGREVDEIITPTGNKLIVHFFTGILEHFKEIDEFQVVQKKKDLLVIKVVPNTSLSQEVIKNIKKIIKEKGAYDMEIEVEEVISIPLYPTGKRRFIIKEI